MSTFRALFVFLTLVPLSIAQVAADDKSAGEREAASLAARIDQHIAAGWQTARVTPAPRSDDAEFVRRIYIDLAGRIPTVAEARAFLSDPGADKRDRLIARLLESPRFAMHFARVWRDLLLPEANTNPQVQYSGQQFERWLRKRFAANTGYDAMVRDILTVAVNQESMNNMYRMAEDATAPVAFFLAKEFKPENLAAGTSRLFLGVRLECAQCHNHPFASWSREQFWNYAAFFASIRKQPSDEVVMPARERNDLREIEIAGTGRVVQASFPDGKEPQFKYKVSARQTLADWMTSADNPYFARATVNRMWAFLLGTGLVEPVDEMFGAERSAIHPQLLDELARELAAHKFDLKFLIRAITLSQVYQLSSAGAVNNPELQQRFARGAVRGMSPEQLYDSLATAIGSPDGMDIQYSRFFPGGSPRAEFLARFVGQSERTTEHQTSILQALTLMNGKLLTAATDSKTGTTLAAVTDMPFMDTRGRIETLYLATMTRRPSEPQLARMATYVDGEADRSAALADIFWALLNSGEFLLNH